MQIWSRYIRFRPYLDDDKRGGQARRRNRLFASERSGRLATCGPSAICQSLFTSSDGLSVGLAEDGGPDIVELDTMHGLRELHGPTLGSSSTRGQRRQSNGEQRLLAPM
jgi:hypothetical protein